MNPINSQNKPYIKSSLVEGGNGHLTSKIWQLHHVEMHKDGEVLCYVLPTEYNPFFPGNDVEEISRNFSYKNQRLAAVEQNPFYSFFQGFPTLPVQKGSIEAWAAHCPKIVNERVAIMTEELKNTPDRRKAQQVATKVFPNLFLGLDSYNHNLSFEANCQEKTGIILKQLEEQKAKLRPNFEADEEKAAFFSRLGFSYGFDQELNEWVLKSPSRELIQNRWAQLVQEMPNMPSLSFAACEGVATHTEFAKAHTQHDRLLADGENAHHDSFSHVLSLLGNLYGIHKNIWYYKNNEQEVTTPAKIYSAYKKKLTSEIEKAIAIISQYRQSETLPPKCSSIEEKKQWLSVWESMLGAWVDDNTAIGFLINLERESRTTRAIHRQFRESNTKKDERSRISKFYPEGDLYWTPKFPRADCIAAWKQAFDALSQQ